MNKPAAVLMLMVSFVCFSVYSSHCDDRKYNLDGFEKVLPEYMAKFKSGLGVGDYSYRPGSKKTDLYGTTDMVYLLYTMNMMDTLTAAQKEEWAATIQKFQNPKTGLFGGNVTLHGAEHAAAYAVGALRILGAKPLYPMTSFVNKYGTPDKVEKLMRGLPWDAIWSGSHIGSGIPSALINTGAIGSDWTDAYFEWVDRETDPATGYVMLNSAGGQKKKATRDELGGVFHFHYIYTYIGRPLVYPERLIDTTISLQLPNGLYDGDVPYCIDLDGVFEIIRAFRQLDGKYREADVKASVEKNLAAITERVNDREFVMTRYTDSHKIVGAIVALSEIQVLFPNMFETTRSLNQVLDFSPFI